MNLLKRACPNGTGGDDADFFRFAQIMFKPTRFWKP